MIKISEYSQINGALNTVDIEATESLNKGKPLYVTWSTEAPTKDMTTKQRGALHVWCNQFAGALNDAGFHRKRIQFLSLDNEFVEENWTKETFKEDVYKVMLEALTGKGSTEEQTTVDPSTVADHINRHIGQTKGVTVGWPSLR